MKTAFLIIDVQKAYIEEHKQKSNYYPIMEKINHTAETFRNLGHPVIVIRHIEEGNTEEFQNVDELIVKHSDHQITKVHNNSFYQTELDYKLKELQVDTIILAGNALEFCITATFFGGLERGYHAYLLEDSIFSVLPSSLIDLGLYRPLIAVESVSHLLEKKDIL